MFYLFIINLLRPVVIILKTEISCLSRTSLDFQFFNCVR